MGGEWPSKGYKITIQFARQNVNLQEVISSAPAVQTSRALKLAFKELKLSTSFFFTCFNQTIQESYNTYHHPLTFVAVLKQIGTNKTQTLT